MNRRAYLATAAATIGLAGCTNSDSSQSASPSPTTAPTATPTPTPTATPTATEPPATTTQETSAGPTNTVPEYDADRVRDEAVTLRYDTVFRNIEKHRGQAIYYKRAQVYQTLFYDTYEYLQMYVSSSSTEWQGDVAVVWDGEERLLENDYMEAWFVVEGLHTYTTTQDQRRTIPLLTLVDYNLDPAKSS